MIYRKMDENGDYMFGNGSKDFWKDVPDAPAQAVLTRLHLEQGEWFLDTSDGTPWRTRVLGFRTEDTRDPVIKMRVLGTKGVKSILTYDSDLNRNTRHFFSQLTIDTVYGRATVQDTL